MRKDIFERVKLMKKENIKPNYAAIARQYDSDYRTVKRYFELESTENIPRKTKVSKLDPFKEIIREKVILGCTAYSIFLFIQKKGFEGKYSIVKVYCRNLKKDGAKKATIRFESNPGLQAQVDWKEKLTLESKTGEKYVVSIFLMLLGYSRKKFITLTIDQTQDTLKNVMVQGFKYFQGIPKEILFDNMKTVVDKSKTFYEKAVINEKFYQFSKDMGFEVWACRPYRPQTKGKVEALARVMNRLIVYNNEFQDIDELSEIVDNLRDELNEEVSQATGVPPNELWAKEKEYLLPLPNNEILSTYLTTPIVRKVTKESMVMYNRKKYSLPLEYIGKTVEIKEENGQLFILYGNKLICSHQITNKPFNYKMDHVIKILKSDAMKHSSNEDIEEFAKKQILIYDRIGDEI